MATYTENYNLKMPSGQDAPDVEDFNTNAEIIDTVLKAHSDNTADEYSPDETYTAGRLVIQNNALWKAKQDIDVAEPWTPDHWELTTLAAELSAVNSSTSLQLSEYIVLIHSGNVVHIDIYIASTTYSVGWNTIGTIPEELRPGLDVQVVAMDNGASSREDSFPIQLRITTSGDINAYIWPSHLTAQIYGNVTYIIP